MPGRRAILALAALLSLPAFGQELTVFAASSLQNAFEEVGRLYRQATGGSVRFSFAASSALARQIEQGAPAALFVSADEQWMDYLAERGLIVPGTRKPLLGNQLVLVVPADRSVTLELKPGFDMRGLLGPDGRWVTGDPAGVPVGRYAREALTSLGVWDFAQTRLVRAENVRVALLFVERGEVAAGVVYQTDAAIASNVRVVGVFPANAHAPISYPVAVVADRDGADARRFLRFLDSTDARAAFGRHGFSVR